MVVGTSTKPPFILLSQVEQIQRKAARYVFNDYRDRSPGAVTNMIDTLQWDSLACRRTSLILLYKINGGLVEVPTVKSNRQPDEQVMCT
jgi:hypothetical protein